MKLLAIPVAALMLAAFDSPQQGGGLDALDAAMAKADACAETPSHACVIDILWDAASARGGTVPPETARAFIETAMTTGDPALVDLYVQRTNWRNTATLDGYRINAARRLNDAATLVHHADRAISGLRYDWYNLRDLAVGMAEAGDLDRAGKLAALIPHAPSDSLTARNLHRQTQEAISFHSPGAAGQYGGSFAQIRAAEALATLTSEAFVAAAKAQTGQFSLARQDVLRAALLQTEDRAYGHAIASLMVDLAELRDLYAYDLARAAAEWARDACDDDLFARAEGRLGGSDDGDVLMWRARLSGGARDAADVAALSHAMGSSFVDKALAGYEAIILKGYCPA